MCDRELTQLISAAQYYLDAAESLQVPDHELARAVSADSNRWSTDRRPRALSSLDIYSAHLASSAIRLATIQEILVGDARKARASAYTNAGDLSGENLRSVTTRAIEILLRDNVVMPSTTPKETSEPRLAGLHWLSSRSLSLRMSFGVVIRRLPSSWVDSTMPNTAFHLTPASLPSVARSAAGERQR